MSGFGRGFDPSELADAAGGPFRDTDAAGLLATARDLEEFARTEFVMPTVGFEDRVMAAVAAEAQPRLIVSGGGFLPGLIATVRDAWRITWSGGRPIAVRAQAFALVLLVAVAAGSAGTLAAVGAANLLSGDEATPAPTPTVEMSPQPISPSPSPSPSATPSSSPSSSPSASTEPSKTPDASESAEPAATNNGSGATQTPTRTPPPTARPTPSPQRTTPEPTETPRLSDTPEPTGTPDLSDTPEPTST